MSQDHRRIQWKHGSHFERLEDGTAAPKPEPAAAPITQGDQNHA